MAAVRRIDPVSKYVEETLPAECGTKHRRGENKSCPRCKAAREVVFVDALPSRRGGRGKKRIENAWEAVLREQPMRWALVETLPDAEKLRHRAAVLVRALRRHGFEVRARGCSIYARFLGEQP